MNEFVLLYRGYQRPTSPEVQQQTTSKWMAWLKELGEKGHVLNLGNPLEPNGKLVTGKQKSVTDGPFAEAKDVIGGYTLISAKDLNQAAELSKGCPIFDHGGFVEVRPIMKM